MTRGRADNGSAPHAFPAVLVAVTAALVAATAGCARPGAPGRETAGDPPPRTEMTASPRGPGRVAAGPLPADTAWCAVAAQPAPRPPRSATDEPATTSEPAPDRARRLRDTLRRAQEAAYPQRGALPPAAAAGGLACAGQVAQGLNLRAAGGPVGADDVRGVLRTIGLAEVTVRSAGADGLAFAGWTGQACVFGTRRAGRDSIGYGVRRPGGSCLPADG